MCSASKCRGQRRAGERGEAGRNRCQSTGGNCRTKLGTFGLGIGPSGSWPGFQQYSRHCPIAERLVVRRDDVPRGDRRRALGQQHVEGLPVFIPMTPFFDVTGAERPTLFGCIETADHDRRGRRLPWRALRRPARSAGPGRDRTRELQPSGDRNQRGSADFVGS